MSIRRRLLLLLLPPIILFLLAISSFFYLNWSQEILNGFQTQLQSVAMTATETFSPKQVKWLKIHLSDSKEKDLSTFRELSRALTNIRKQIHATHLAIVELQPVDEGERIFPDKAESGKNPVRSGEEPLFREVTLLESKKAFQTDETLQPAIGKIRRGKPLAAEAYEKKKTVISSPYFSAHRKTTIMTAYAPILTDSEEVVALIVVHATLEKIEYEKSRALLIMAVVSLIAILLMVFLVSWVAESLNKPVRRLNAAALAIAAGEYGEQIQVEGPKEVQDLANTFNTMSQCLNETIGRLQERSASREKTYGEYECSLLLQYFMLQRKMESFGSRRLDIELIKTSAGMPSRSIQLETVKGDQEETLQFLEAQKPGFEGTYHLLGRTNPEEDYPSLLLKVDDFNLTVEENGFPPPILWDHNEETLNVLESETYPFRSGDLLFLFNTPLLETFSGPRSVERWLSKVLRHFGKEDPSLLHSMLRNEVQFLMKKKPLMEDPILICLRRL